MKFRMAEKSLFAVLLRSRWWVSVLVAAGWIAVAMALLPKDLRPVGVLGAAPFIVIAGIAGWRQLRSPSPATLQARLDAAASMGWPEFEQSLKTGLGREGWLIAAAGEGADLRIDGAGPPTLVSARRWKAARHGEEALQALRHAMDREGVARGFYVTLGVLTPQAAKIAREGGIEVLQGEALAKKLA